MMDEETRHIAMAVAALGDRFADKRVMLEEIQKTEPDLTRGRGAQRRHQVINEPTDEAA